MGRTIRLRGTEIDGSVERYRYRSGSALPMSTRRNIAANFLGKVWTGAMNFAFVPIYVKLLGIEAYGLIGFFTSLMALSLLFDLGLSTTINRELARLSASDASPKHARDLVRSLEYIYWGTGALLGIAIVALAPWLGKSWLSPHNLSVRDTSQAIMLMGAVVFLRWPVALYNGGLMGLHRQVLANGLSIAMATLQGGGTVLVLWLISPTIQAFFLAQLAAGIVQMVLLPYFLWRSLPNYTNAPAFSTESLKSIWRFAAGMSGITICSVVLTQSDKFLLSKFLPLENFGYYVLAGSIAGVLNLPSMAMYAALFPAFSSLASDKRSDALVALYHRSCQFLSVLLMPATVALAAFSKELLSYYVHDATIVANTHVLLSLISVGNMFLSIMVLPLALQLAYGWTKLSFYKNVVAVLIMVPVMIVMIRKFGAVGAAITWITLPLGYLFIEVPLMHRRLLRTEKRKWYFKDIGFPLFVSVVVVVTARLLIPSNSSAFVVIPVLAVSLALACGCSVLFLHRYGDLKY
jgi:O-antigen/teichoic acid export membrane protein